MADTTPIILINSWKHNRENEMAANSVSGATQNILQQVNIRKAAEGDANSAKAGQTEKTGEAGKAAEITKDIKPDAPMSPAKPFGPYGNNVDVYA